MDVLSQCSLWQYMFKSFWKTFQAKNGIKLNKNKNVYLFQSVLTVVLKYSMQYDWPM